MENSVSDSNKNLSSFLSKHKINPDSINMDNLCTLIREEMRKGLTGQKSSLQMLNSYCSPVSKIKIGEKAIVIDAGGTNLRTCLVSFDENRNPTIEDFNKTRMPGVDKEVSAQEFFSIMADETERLIDKSDRVGFCFSYPTKMEPNHDGKTLYFSKEVKAPEVIGKFVGKELFLELERRGHSMSEKKITILNDTVTTLLAGLSKSESLGCEGCIGFILGTGSNTACSINGTIINEESGNLNFVSGDLDQDFINSTENSNVARFEKQISGAYIGQCCKTILNAAKTEGLLSSTFVVPKDLNTKNVGDFLDMLESPIIPANETEKEVVYEILKNYVVRAGKLAASALAAAVLESGAGRDKPVLINIDGTTFYKTRFLQESTESYLNGYLKKFKASVKYIKIDDSPVIGSAIAALSLT